MWRNVSYHAILIWHRNEFSAEHKVGSHLKLSDIIKIQSSPALGDFWDFQFVYTISNEESVHFEFSYVPSIHILPTSLKIKINYQSNRIYKGIQKICAKSFKVFFFSFWPLKLIKLYVSEPFVYLIAYNIIIYMYSKTCSI